jgi:hypothetical protein
VPAPIELVRDLVFGSVEYARGLGFDPHPDFYLAAAHLGAWEPPGRITFGVEGRPLYQHGPYDDPTRIVRILDRTAGQGNYDVISVVGFGDGSSAGVSAQTRSYTTATEERTH